MARIPLQRASTKGALVTMRTVSSLYPLFTAIVYVPTLNLLHLRRLDLRDVVSAASRGLIDLVRSLGDVVAATSRGLVDCIGSLADVVSAPTISLCIGEFDRT